jgi:hypothetical protein
MSAVGAVLLGWMLAHGPAEVRRPLLTALAVGALVGVGVRRIESGFPAGGVARGATAVAGALLSLAVLHAETFRRIAAAAEARARANPEERQALAFLERFPEDDAAARMRTRALRLAVAPSASDYVAHRAAPLTGEREWPAGAALLAVEALAAAAVAGAIAARGVSGSEPSLSESVREG